MIRIGVLLTQSLVRSALVILLRSLGFEGVIEAATLDRLKENSNGSPPEIVLVGLSPDDTDISDRMAAFRDWAPSAKVVFLASNLDLKQLSGCFAAGASGYLLEDLSGDALEKSLTLVAAGEKVFPSELASIMANAVEHDVECGIADAEGYDLSPREMRILRLLAEGRSNKVIAAMLNVSESTAKLDLRNILRKLRATNRTQAALWAVRRGIGAEPTASAANEPGMQMTLDNVPGRPQRAPQPFPRASQ